MRPINPMASPPHGAFRLPARQRTGRYWRAAGSGTSATLARAEGRSMVAAAERHERIVDCRRAIGTVRCDRAEKRAEQIADRTRLDIARNEDQPGAGIVVGPSRQGSGRVEYVLHPMDDRSIRCLGELHDAFQAK